LELAILEKSIEIVAIGQDDKGGSIGAVILPAAETEHELVVEHDTDALK